MRLTVELFGHARWEVGRRDIELEMENGAILRNVIQVLAQEYPRLIDSQTLSHDDDLPFICYIGVDGRQIAHSLDHPLEPGAHIALIPIEAGG